MIYVTHDQVEAMTLADKIVVLHDGRGRAGRLAARTLSPPGNLFVAGFIGSPKMNFIDVKASAVSAEGVTVAFAGGASLTIPVSADGIAPGQSLALGARPEHISLSPDGQLDGEVLVVERLGGETYLYVQVAPDVVAIVQDGGNSRVKVHEQVRLSVEAAASHLFRDDGRAVPLLSRHPLAA